MPTITKKEIQKLVAKNKLVLCFEVLSEAIEGPGEKKFSQDLILLEAKYNALKTAEKTGTIRYEDRMVAESQLLSSLTEIISYFPESPIEISDALSVKLRDQVKTAWYKNLLWVLLLLLAGIGCFLWLKRPLPAPGNKPVEIQEVARQPTDTLAQKAPELVAAKSIAELKVTVPKSSMGSNSTLEVAGEMIPLAYIDFAYLPGREQEANTLEDACCYQFEVVNPNQEAVTLQSLFVELIGYEPLPAKEKIMTKQPFDEATVVYILMGANPKKGANIYRNLFYLVNDKRKNWGKIKLAPKESIQVAARVNAKKPGVYTFQLGFEYYSASNDSIVRKDLLPRQVKWAFKSAD